jgi:cold shock CspA family protein
LAAIDDESPAPRVARTPRPRRAAPARAAQPDAPHASATPNAEAEPKAAAPTLVRRAELAAQAPAEPAALLAPMPAGAIRGVVQWFDSRAGHGALRLPGFSRDVSVDAATLASFGVARLFKGQEIEATLEGAGEHTRLASLRLVNAAPATPVSGGTVHDRHAKMVVVELKNQPQRRNAARAEAELLLSARRAPK